MFTCISLELQVRTGSNLETRYRYHPWSQSYQKNICNAMQVQSTIMGRNGGVVLRAYFQMVFSTDLEHFIYPRSTIHRLDLILLCNLLQCCGTRSVSTSVWVFHHFPMFKRVENIISPHTGVKVPNLDMSCSTNVVLKSKASCPPNLESAVIL